MTCYGGFHEAADAAEAPVGIGHFADETVFGEVVGPEVGGEFGEEFCVFGGVVAGKQDGGGAETVGKTVAGGGDLGSCGHGRSFRKVEYYGTSTAARAAKS